MEAETAAALQRQQLRPKWPGENALGVAETAGVLLPNLSN